MHRFIDNLPFSTPSDAPISEDTLWGSYDEDAAAQSFADAVKSWRGEETSTGIVHIIWRNI